MSSEDPASSRELVQDLVLGCLLELLIREEAVDLELVGAAEVMSARFLFPRSG